MRYYFGYGSNMWDAQMASRCPESRKIGRACLRNYRWIITSRGYANVVEAPGEEVEGVLFLISEKDEASLDGFEGVATGFYRKVDLPVSCGGDEVMALVYIDPTTSEGKPKEEYIHRINAGLVDAELSAAYVARHVRRFIPEGVASD
jgi:gamma-glutamylcyclotransferase